MARRQPGAGPRIAADLLQLARAAANAERYDAPALDPLPPSLARLVEFTAPEGDWTALDLATGAGATAFALAPHVAHVVATDLSPQALAVAAHCAAGRSVTNIEFREADACVLPFAPESFDLVTCRDAPHRFARIENFLAEAHRVLKPRALLGIVDPLAPDHELVEGSAAEAGEAAVRFNAMELLRDPDHKRFLGLGEWRTLVRRCGYALMHEETISRPMTLRAWAGQTARGHDYLQTLARMLEDAPAALRAFLRPERRGDDWSFTLTDALLVCRRA